MFIGPEAVGTDTYEINRNLVLSDGARADSVPNLEIETGEVSEAGHASATGRFDDDALFYLMSRGIAPMPPAGIVVRSFFAEVLDAIPVERYASGSRRRSTRSSRATRRSRHELDPGLHARRARRGAAAVSVSIGDEAVCVARSEGKVYAVRDVCSHAEIALE